MNTPKTMKTDNVAAGQLVEGDFAAEQRTDIIRECLAFTNIAVIEWDVQGCVTSWSKNAELIFGWTEREMMMHRQSPIHLLVRPEDVTEISLLVDMLKNGKQGHNNSDNRNMTKDGRVIWCEWFNTARLDSAGNVLSVISVVKDLTAFKIAEEKMQQANHLYAFISQLNQNIVRIHDRETLFKNACAFAVQFGKFAMAWIGIFNFEKKTVSMADHSGIPAAALTRFNNVPYKTDSPQYHVLRTGQFYKCNNISQEPELQSWEPFAAEYGIYSFLVLPILKSGEVIGTFNLYSSEINFSGVVEINLLTEVSKDISFALDNFDRIEKHDDAEKLVIKNEIRFRGLIEKSDEIITLVNRAGKTVYAGPSIFNILGYTDKEFREMNFLDLIHPDDIPALQLHIDKIFDVPGASFRYQERVKRKNGIWIWCEGTVTNMFHEPGINALVSNFRDISDRKILEQQRDFNKKNLAALINNTPDLMWSVDTDYKLITCNRGFTDYIESNIGVTIEKGDSILHTVFTERELVFYKGCYDRAFAGEMFKILDHETSPEESWTEISFNPIQSGDRVIGTACQSRDITESKTAEERLVKSESRLQKAQEIARMGNWEMKFATREVLWSEEVCRIYGVPTSENRQTMESWLSFIHPEDLEYVLKSVREPSVAERLPFLNNRIVLRDGTVKHIYSEFKSETDKEGRPIGLYGIAQDITERQQAIAEISASSRALEKAVNDMSKIMDSSLDIICTLDFEGRFIDVSAASEKIWGYTPDELCQIPYMDLLYPEDYEKSFAMSKLLREGVNVTMFENRFVHKNGRIVWLLWSANYDADEDVMFSVAKDITEKKEAEVALEAERKLYETERNRLLADLTMRNRGLEQFTYILSHNLRAPVANILGISMLLSDTQYKADNEDYLLNALHDSVTNLDNVVLDLNQILKAKGSINETKEAVVFENLVADIKLSISALTLLDDMEIVTDFSEVGGLFSLKSYMYSIFYNLISNSVKYRRKDTVGKLLIRSRRSDTGIELTFADNGIGIDLSRNASDVFGLYKRFHRDFDGKGMGLYMVKTQVESLGGQITVTSEVNKGTEFKIVFNTES